MNLDKLEWEIEQIERLMYDIEYEFPASYLDQKEWQELNSRKGSLISELSLSLDQDREY